MPVGRPSPLGPPDPNWRANVPLGWNTWTRLLYPSVTAMIPPGPKATRWGELSSPGPCPDDPNWNANVPLGRNTWIRSLVRSATAMIPPGPKSTPRGW